MTHIISESLLAASMLLGQAGSEPKASAPAPIIQQTQPAPRPIVGFFNREDRPVLNRIQGWFKRDQVDSQPQGKIITPRSNGIRETEPPPLLIPTAPTTEFPKKLPNPSSKASVNTETMVQIDSKGVKQTSVQVNSGAKSPILPNLASKIGRDEKFEWITGQIEIESGNHVMYYATPDTIDKYHGRIVLAPNQADLSQFRRGDLVSIRGQLVQRQSAQGIIPIYRVTHASLIERQK